MKEITNRTNGPIQLVVKSANKPRAFTTLLLYGKGSGRNVILLEDEKYTSQIGVLEDKKIVSIRTI